MEDGSEMIMTGGDPAGMDYDGDGNPIEEEVAPMADATGTKIDYSREDPVPFQKTATLVNYFITNTAQFLNT